MFKLVIPAVLLFSLSACDQGGQLAQQAASAVAAVVGQEVKTQTNAIIEQTMAEANEALTPLGIDANKVSSALKNQATTFLGQALKSPSDWQALNAFTGKTATEIGLFTAISPIDAELNRLLGADAAAFKALLASAILKQERVLYLFNQQQDKTTWLLIDTETRQLEIGQINNGKLKTFASQGQALYRPSDIAALVTK